jgi:hypothetical protein
MLLMFRRRRSTNGNREKLIWNSESFLFQPVDPGFISPVRGKMLVENNVHEKHRVP